MELIGGLMRTVGLIVEPIKEEKKKPVKKEAEKESKPKEASK